ncbi:hypothetical protein [Pseudocnuella soli]|uniref:hypothetical protein n=1 Tax=Pseudocnuella soli TaxID=2502779 RepID=UPI001048968C|nr:hypothetical protein [Pseudocnuella soli]
MKKWDNLKLGLLLALLLPVLIFFGIYFGRFSYYPFGEFWQTLREESRLITFFAAWCLVANIALFTVFINTRRYRTARGVFIVTVIYGALFLMLKFLA